MIVARLTLAACTALLAVPAFAQSGDTDDFTSPRPRGGVVAPGAWAVAATADEPPKLGVMVSDTEDGVLVSEVFDGSLAASAGLQEGDVLFRLAGQRVEVVSDIPAILAEHTEPGGQVAITVIREGEGLVTVHGERARPAPVVEHHEQHGDNTWTPSGSPSGPGGAFLGIGLGGDGDQGAVVSSIYDGTAAWFVGLKEGDVLTRVGKMDTPSGEAVAKAVAAHSAGDMVELRWIRGDRVIERVIRLGHRLPENPLGMLDLDGLPKLEGMPFGDGPLGLAFDGEHPVIMEFDGDGHDWGAWAEKLHRDLQGGLHQQLELGGPGGHGSMSIELKDGKVILNRNGATQVIELDGPIADGAAFQLLEDGGSLSLLPFGDGASAPLEGGECSEIEEACEDAKAACEDAKAACDEVKSECSEAKETCEEVEADIS